MSGGTSKSMNGSSEDGGGDKPEGLLERYERGVSLAESSPQEALKLLESVKRDVAALAIFSSNETIEDISTKSIPLLALDHFLALSLVSLPAGPGMMVERKANIVRALDMWSSFLLKLEGLELLTQQEANECRELMEESDSNGAPRPQDRDAKIARFKAKQKAKQDVERLKSFRERRERLGVSADDQMDGHDDESLGRTVALTELTIYKEDAFDAWLQSKRELPMIEMMVKMEEEKARQKNCREQNQQEDDPRRKQLSAKPMKLTHITKDSASGKLQIRRDEVRSQVFRPGWNQPTMTLEELGERELRQALEREERQRQAEAQRAKDPRRYEDLVRDGLEDNADLVDASAKLDRDWDDWKDENPRGSGNKMGNRGDRNF